MIPFSRLDSFFREALAENAGATRDGIFLTTKLAAESKSLADARGRIDASLNVLACVD